MCVCVTAFRLVTFHFHRIGFHWLRGVHEIQPEAVGIAHVYQQQWVGAGRRPVRGEVARQSDSVALERQAIGGGHVQLAMGDSLQRYRSASALLRHCSRRTRT